MKQTAIVMYYIKDKEKERKLMQLCEKLQLSTKKVKLEDANRTIGELVGISGTGFLKTKAEKAPAGYLLPELLIFSGMSDKKLDEFLGEYRRQKIEPIGLKAIVTLDNISWSLYELTKELIKEQTAIIMGNIPGQ